MLKPLLPPNNHSLHDPKLSHRHPERVSGSKKSAMNNLNFEIQRKAV